MRCRLKDHDLIYSVVIAEVDKEEDIDKAFKMHENCPEYIQMVRFASHPKKFCIISVSPKEKEWWIRWLEDHPHYVFAKKAEVYVANPETFKGEVILKMPRNEGKTAPCVKSCTKCPGYKVKCDGCRATEYYIGRQIIR